MSTIRYLAGALLVIALAACSLSTQSVTTPVAELPTNTPPTLPTTAPTNAPTNTPPPTATNRPTTSGGSTSGGIVPTACVPRGDWPIYTVVSGDTLADIARRSNSSVSVLTTANCLSNPNNITVGQQIRVPNVPSAPTPSIVYFRITAAPIPGGPQMLEWDTRGAASVLITQIPPSGVNGKSYPNLSATGSMAMPALGAEYAPTATFNLFLRDSGGRDIVGSNGQLISAVVTVAVNGGVVPYSFTANPNPADRGGQITISWSVPQATGLLSLVLLNQHGGGGTTIANNLGSSGSFVATVPLDYTHGVAFALYGANGTGDYGYLSVPIRAEPCPFPVYNGNGAVSFSPATYVSDGCYKLTPGSTLTLSVPNAPANFTSIEYYFLPVSGIGGGTPGNPNVITSDNNPADGSTATWAVPMGNYAGSIYAFVYGPNGMIETDSIAVTVQ